MSARTPVGSSVPDSENEESPEDFKLPPVLEFFKNCLMGIVGLSLMAYAEWLSFEKEQSKREFFERQERIEDVQDRLQERLDRARASRTPFNFEDVWNSVEKEVEERHRLEAERAGTAPTTSSSPARGR